MPDNARNPIPPALAGIKVIDADTHISEWDDLWTSRATPKFKDRVPQKRMIDGKLTWTIDGTRSLGTGSPMSAVRHDGSKCNNFDFTEWQLSDAHPGAYNVKERVHFMDDNGIYAQIAYPNILGFSGQRSLGVDAALRLVSMQIFNDAMAELQQDSGNRIFPMALLPWWDLKESVAEAKRCSRLGLRGININPDPHFHGLPGLSDPHWRPLWDVCIENSLPVNFHIGSSDETLNAALAGHWGRPEASSQLAYNSVMLFISNSRVLTNIFLTLFLEDLPDLKIVSVESGIGWLPFLLESVEYEMRETGIKYKIPPSELFRRQIYGCSWFERESLTFTARKLGIGNVLFETDFPHPTCLYPNALDYVADVAGTFTAAERAKVFGGNAAKLYRIPTGT
jgi:predicted TIM-barrel fold metal-dependent hydrolase